MVKQQTSKQYFITFRIVFIGLFAGQLLLAVVLGLLQQTLPVQPIPVNTMQALIYAVPVLLVFCVLISSAIFRKRISALLQEPDFKKRLTGYRNLYVIRYAITELPVLFALIVAFVSKMPVVWLYAAIGIVCFYVLRPTREKLLRELVLPADEIALLDDPGAIVAEINVKNYRR